MLRISFLLIVLITVLLLVTAPLAHAKKFQEAVNKVVIIIDGSGSFKKRQHDALARATSLLNDMSQTKVHRWESGQDAITIISLDAVPDVLWSGSLSELKSMDQKQWADRFLARADLSRCTDVDNAFHLAVRHLEGDPKYVRKYLLVFSDLISEPPTNSVNKCSPALNTPSMDFPWEALQDTSVSVFFAPPDQKLTWLRAAQAQGFEGNFAIYSNDSSEVTIAPPPRPKVTRTDEERDETKERVMAAGLGVIKFLVYCVIGILILIITPLFLRRFRSQRPGVRRSPRPLPRNMLINRPDGTNRTPPASSAPNQKGGQTGNLQR